MGLAVGLEDPDRCKNLVSPKSFSEKLNLGSRLHLIKVRLTAIVSSIVF
jgi:hypothetical protein